MNELPKKPCAACPYLKSAPRGFWSPEEFARVQEQDHPFGRTFGCHLNSVRAKEDQDSCVGYLADQKRRDIPSMFLRLELATKPEQAERFDAINADDPELFGSIAEMVEANSDLEFPEEDLAAQRLLKKLGKD